MINSLGVLRTRGRLLAVTALLGGAAGLVAFLTTPPLYTATTTTFVSVNGAAMSAPTSLDGSDLARQRVTSYVDIVTTDNVMIGVIEDLGLPLTPGQLANKIDVNNPRDTVSIEISVTDPNPALAQSAANATAEQFTDLVTRLETPSTDEIPIVTVTTVEPAPLPSSQSSPLWTKYVGLGLLAGLAFGVLAVVAQGLRRVEQEAAIPD